MEEEKKEKYIILIIIFVVLIISLFFLYFQFKNLKQENIDSNMTNMSQANALNYNDSENKYLNETNTTQTNTLNYNEKELNTADNIESKNILIKSKGFLGKTQNIDSTNNTLDANLVANEIFYDRKITISYEPIELPKGIIIQTQTLTVKNEIATLVLYIDEYTNNSTVYVDQIKIFDTSDGKNELLKIKKIENEENVPRQIGDTIEFNISKRLLKTIRLELIDTQNEKISDINIDLSNEQLDFSNQNVENKKRISEIELKKVLGDYTVLNSFKEDPEFYKNAGISKSKCFNTYLIYIATNNILWKEIEQNIENKNLYELEKVNKALKEITANDFYEPLEHDTILDLYYSEEENGYKNYPGDSGASGLCLDIINLDVSNDIYTIDFYYCHPSEWNILEETIYNCDIYKTKMKLKLNENYEYAQFCLLNYNELTCEKVK